MERFRRNARSPRSSANSAITRASFSVAPLGAKPFSPALFRQLRSGSTGLSAGHTAAAARGPADRRIEPSGRGPGRPVHRAAVPHNEESPGMVRQHRFQDGRDMETVEVDFGQRFQ